MTLFGAKNEKYSLVACNKTLHWIVMYTAFVICVQHFKACFIAQLQPLMINTYSIRDGILKNFAKLEQNQMYT